MAAERAYLIVSHPAHLGKQARARARAAWSDRAAATRRPRPAPQGPVRPRCGHSLPPRTTAADGGIAALVRRTRRPGRHRLGTPGLRPYRPVRAGSGVLVRRVNVRRAPGQHCARHAASTGTRRAARFATLLVLFTTMVVSGWFAASGASTFAQILQP
jgi:hypothetical protein